MAGSHHRKLITCAIKYVTCKTIHVLPLRLSLKNPHHLYILQEMEQKVEEERRGREEARDSLLAMERRCNNFKVEAEELQASLENADRGRKNAEAELTEALDRVNELTATNSSLQGQKRKLDSDISAMQVRRRNNAK